MQVGAERSQAAGNDKLRHSKGQLALIGGALTVFAIAGILLGSAVVSREQGESSAIDGVAPDSAGGSLSAAGTGDPERVRSLDAISAELEALRRDLETERRARQLLATQLASLTARVGSAVSGSSSKGAAPRDRREENAEIRPPVSAAPIGATPAESINASAANQQDKPWFNRAALERAGISSSEIAEIEEHWEQHEMAKLYLDDQSKREGSFGTPEYNKDLIGLRLELREDLGAEGYDAYLYATGQPNRVRVRQVLENSPAGRAGLQAGDEIISYSGDRVYRPRQLKNATSAGEFGDSVVVEVLRDGRTIRIHLPRGPLGVSLESITALPWHGGW